MRTCIMIDGDDREEAVGGHGDRRPLRVFLGDSHPRNSLELEMLPRPDLDDRNPRIVARALLLGIQKVRRRHERIVGFEICRCDGHGERKIVRRGCGMSFANDALEVHVEVEFDRAAGTSLVADAFAMGEEGAVAVAGTEGIGGGVREGKKAETMCDVFVVEDGGVFGEFDEVDGERGDLGDHDAAKGVGDRGVGLGEDEFYLVRFDG